MAPNVLDTARLLQATAGYDNIDDRQLGAPLPSALPDYIKAVQEGASVKGMKIGVLKEAFESKLLAGTVKGLVEAAMEKYRDLGATVEYVSVPT